MWNHSSKSVNPKVVAEGVIMGVGGGGGLEKNSSGDLVEKVEKHLDLTNYLNFLQTLFSLSTSDSESSDVETADSLVALDLNNPDPAGVVDPSATSVKIASKPSSSELISVPQLGQLILPTTTSVVHKLTGNDGSSDSSSFSPNDDDTSFLPSDLTPMSDLELNNLLKRTNYLGSDVEVEPLSFELEDHDTRTKDCDKKKSSKKKKRKSNKSDLDELPRQNRPNSGGRGNGSSHTGGSGLGGFNGSVSDRSGNSSSRGSSNNSNSNGNNSGGGGSQLSRSVNCVRKQSLKCAPNSKLSAPSRIVCVKGGNDLPSSNVAITNSVITTKSAKLSLSGNSVKNMDSLKYSKHKSSIFTKDSSDLHLALDDSDDDNDSLSDYLSMAATAASTAHVSPFPQPLSNSDDGFLQVGEMFSDDSPSSVGSKSETGDESGGGHKGRKRKRETSEKNQDVSKNKKMMLQKQAKFIELMNLKRKRIYISISKKEVPKAQRTTFTTHKDMLAVKRRLAQACSRAVRQLAIQSQKTMKESAWRAKRLTREMQAFWKQADRVEKESKKRKDKKEEEQRKQDVEVLEAKRLEQNLNFLITETELYAHLVTRNIHEGGLDGNDDSQAQTSILERLKGESLESHHHEVESLKIKAKINVHEAVEAQKIHTKLFNIDSMSEIKMHIPLHDTEIPYTSRLFSGSLKNYQILGVNWLTKLFDHGINGVLADEMGLGKTVQSIAFLAHLAEKCGIWGPFLVIAPSSSLHQWQLEIKRFVSDFKIVPYWGNPQERKILRQFWQQTNLHTPEATFHVVVTSYNVVVQDLKYFNKVKWQYLILDEAQSIKTAVSTRWKALIGFNCRNRLLLTGIPIQSSINELLSLLHFIMPSLFISQEDFGDCLAKDIESQADSRRLVEKKNVTRLYTVLQQFMLRRTKKDVESELCDKIELLVSCPITTRQRFFHAALVRKIITEDLLKMSSSSSPSSSPQNDGRNLMSLVMQFTKVCNHPDLFEGRDMRSPLFMDKIFFCLPKLLFQDQVGLDVYDCARNYLLKERFSIFKPSNIHASLYRKGYNVTRRRKPIEDVHVANVFETSCEWSFIRFSGLTTGDIYKFICGGAIERMMNLVKSRREMCARQNRRIWNDSRHLDPAGFLVYNSFLEEISETTLQNLVFTSYTKSFYKWKYVTRFPTNELFDDVKVEPNFVIPNDSCTNDADAGFNQPWDLEPLLVPKFLFNLFPKVKSAGIHPYVSDGPTSKWMMRTVQCSSLEFNLITYGSPDGPPRTFLTPKVLGGLMGLENVHGWSGISVPDKERLVTDSGKLMVLDGLLKNLKVNGHRVVIFSLLPKMMDLLEEYFWYRKWAYIRVDGQKNYIEFHKKPDTFAILLTTTSRAGVTGYDLSEMDTIIFYDSDWNSAIHQQTVDLADRLGQTGHAKQVTVYKLFCKGTIEERMLRKIKHKNETKAVNNTEGQLGCDALTQKEVLSILLDDEELDRKYRHRQLDKKVCDKLSDKRPSPNHQSANNLGASVSDPTEPGSIVNGDSDRSKVAAASSGGSCQSQELSPSSQDESDDNMEFDLAVYEEDLSEFNPSTSDYFDNYSRAIEWNNGSTSDYEEDLPFIPKKPKLGRGTGKRGRPPSRIRVQMRDLSSGDLSMRRGPGRPRLKPIGPLNQGIRGRRPGRPPLSKKAETISSSLSASTPRVFGIYNSQDLNISS